MTYNNRIEQQVFSDISADTATFTLRGGRYNVLAIASWNSSGTVTLEILADDGSTYVAVMTALSANGSTLVDVPSGTYKLAVATATGVYASVRSIVTAV